MCTVRKRGEGKENKEKKKVERKESRVNREIKEKGKDTEIPKKMKKHE